MRFLFETEALRTAFTRSDDGYIYYPHRWSEGYPVSVEEYEAYCSRMEKLQSSRAIMPASLVMIAATFGFHAFLEWLMDGPVSTLIVVLPIAILFVAIFYWFTKQPLREVSAREPVAPRRDFS